MYVWLVSERTKREMWGGCLFVLCCSSRIGIGQRAWRHEGEGMVDVIRCIHEERVDDWGMGGGEGVEMVVIVGRGWC